MLSSSTSAASVAATLADTLLDLPQHPAIPLKLKRSLTLHATRVQHGPNTCAPATIPAAGQGVLSQDTGIAAHPAPLPDKRFQDPDTCQQHKYVHAHSPLVNTSTRSHLTHENLTSSQHWPQARPAATQQTQPSKAPTALIHPKSTSGRAPTAAPSTAASLPPAAAAAADDGSPSQPLSAFTRGTNSLCSCCCCCCCKPPTYLPQGNQPFFCCCCWSRGLSPSFIS